MPADVIGQVKTIYCSYIRILQGNFYLGVTRTNFDREMPNLVHRDNFAEPLAEQLYETVCSMFSPEPSIILLEEAQNLVQRNP